MHAAGCASQARESRPPSVFTMHEIFQTLSSAGSANPGSHRNSHLLAKMNGGSQLTAFPRVWSGGWSHDFSAAPTSHDTTLVCTLVYTVQPADLPSLLLHPADYWLFLPPSTGLLGGGTFLLVLKKLHFWFYNFFSYFY